MEFNQYDLYAYQLLDYLVIKHNYQIIRVQQHKDDLWLINAEQEKYPVLRISSKSNDSTIADSDYLRNVHRSILNLIQREGPIMVFNTNPDCIPIENLVLTQIRITPEGISDKKILTTFRELDHVVHESDNMDKDIVKITKDIEEAQLIQQKKITADLKKKSRPKITYGFMGICIVFSLLLYVGMAFIKDDLAAYVASGAFYKMNILAAHEYWRLLSAGFLHQNPIILLINMMALYTVGKSCEYAFKKWQFVSIIVLSMIIGNLFLLVGEANILAMGMGAGVAGILGAFLVQLIVNHSIRHPFICFSFLRISLAVLVLMLLPGLSYLAYLGGFICGVTLGMLYSGEPHLEGMRKHIITSIFILFAGLIYFRADFIKIEPIEKEFDRSIMNVYKNTPLNKYADYLQKCYNKQYRME